MSSSTTFATLRALHSLIGDALDEIELIFAQGVLIDTPSPSSSRQGSGCPRTPETPPPASSIPTTPSVSFPPTPLSATFAHNLDPHYRCSSQSLPVFDYPSPNKPYEEDSPHEQLAAHPRASSAALKVVSACGQMSNIVHKPFLTLCDAIMAYSLPACLRLVEHLHLVEILREAEEKRQMLLPRANRGEAASSRESHSLRGKLREKLSSSHESPIPVGGEDHQPRVIPHQEEACIDFPIALPHQVEEGGRSRARKISETAFLQEGLHVRDIVLTIHAHSTTEHVDPANLAHALRLLATHHLLRETSPDVFALTRVISLLDTGKSVEEVFASPGKKYTGTNGIAAFVGLTADELFKSAAYLTEAFTGVQLPTSILPRREANPPGVAKEVRQTESVGGYIPGSASSVGPSTGRSSVMPMVGIGIEYEDPTMDFESQDLLAHAPGSRSSDIATEGPLVAAALQGEWPTVPAFNLAFQTTAPYFQWLENGGTDPLGKTGVGVGFPQSGFPLEQSAQASLQGHFTKSFRLERFSEAMTGTGGWEAPGAIFNGFDWQSLPKGSTIIDVGGGIGSTTMVLARAFCSPEQDSADVGRTRREQSPLPQIGINKPGDTRAHVRCQSHGSYIKNEAIQRGDRPPKLLNFRFIVQDKPVVIRLGLTAWRSQCPDLLDSGQVEFQEHDFFQPQPLLNPPHHLPYPAVYLLRVVLHDWTDTLAHRILVNLRLAAGPETKLIIADHVLALACVEEGIHGGFERVPRDHKARNRWTLDSILADLEGVEPTLASPPLLPNLGKASANGYWMDMLMHITFNGKERTLREICALALSAGWRVARMSRSEGSLFAHLVCEVIPLPEDLDGNTGTPDHVGVALPSESQLPALSPLPTGNHLFPPSRLVPMSFPPSLLERSTSRCGTPTFGSRVALPPADEIRGLKVKGAGLWSTRKWFKAKGLGMRVAGTHKQQRWIDRIQDTGDTRTKASGFESCDESPDRAIRNSSQSARVWWKKPSISASGSHNSIHSPSRQLVISQSRPAPENNTLARSLHGPITSSAQQPDHGGMPTTRSSNPMVRPRKASIASITQKLSFASFRRPSYADLGPSPPIPTPNTGLPPDRSFSSKQTSERNLRHLRSLPALRFKKAGVDSGPLGNDLSQNVVRIRADDPLLRSHFVVPDNPGASVRGQGSPPRPAQHGESTQSVVPFPPPLSGRKYSEPRNSESPKVRWRGLPRRPSVPLLRRKGSISADVSHGDR